jgi:hypothetical protein
MAGIATFACQMAVKDSIAVKRHQLLHVEKFETA